MLSCLLMKIKSLLLGIVNLVARCFCCMKRRRRNSDNGTPLTIATVNKGDGEPESWDEWGPEIVIRDKKPVTTTDHIEAYRQSLALKRQESEEPEPPSPVEDIFADMAPKIRKQKKVFVGKDEEGVGRGGTSLSRFAPRPECTDPVLAMGSELESWEEAEVGAGAAGWRPEEEGSLADLLREQKSRNKR